MALNIDRAAFTRAWQKARTVREVAKRFKISEGQARSKAAYLRRAGFPLRRFKTFMDDKEREAIRKELR